MDICAFFFSMDTGWQSSVLGSGATPPSGLKELATAVTAFKPGYLKAAQGGDASKKAIADLQAQRKALAKRIAEAAAEKEAMAKKAREEAEKLHDLLEELSVLPKLAAAVAIDGSAVSPPSSSAFFFFQLHLLSLLLSSSSLYCLAVRACVRASVCAVVSSLRFSLACFLLADIFPPAFTNTAQQHFHSLTCSIDRHSPVWGRRRVPVHRSHPERF